MRVALISLATLAATPALAQDAPVAADGAADLAQQLSNPVASLISLPIQNNFDWGLGTSEDGFRYTANVQPVIPISIGADWNMISRTIVPVIAQNDVTGPGTSQFGLGDTTQSLFFSPKVAKNGIVWALGPVFLLPTATDRALGTGKWGAGPTGLILKIDGQATYGLLVNHIWSIAGKSDRQDISASFAQPFFSYTTKGATTYAVNAEASYDWLGDNWLVPVNFTISQLVRLGQQPVSFGGGVKYFIASPTGGPDWGLRLSVTFLFPK
jgi:hypothetical protein